MYNINKELFSYECNFEPSHPLLKVGYVMSSTDLLLPLGWIIGGGFLQTLIICLIICPGLPQLLGYVFDGYWVPWDPRYQFLAFVPGNPFLAWFIASTSVTFQDQGFSLNPIANYTIVAGAFVFYVVLNVMDLGSNYTMGQMKSATKVYHNTLYFWYGYLAVSCFIAMLGTSAPLSYKVLATIPGVLWIGCMVADNFMPEHIQRQRFKFAHVEPIPIFASNFKLRRRTSNGYAFK